MEPDWAELMRKVSLDFPAALIKWTLFVTLVATPFSARAAVYYFSNSTGNDANDGSSSSTALRSIAKFNSLDLSPGDEVRFRCGDQWRAVPLVVRDSGTEAAPILLISDPPGCADQPILSGSRRIFGWSLHSGDIHVADLDEGGNEGRFTNGINQVFRGNQRLPIGRWPNLNQNGGYAVIDTQPQPNVLTDDDLLQAEWTGAALHFKSERWYLYNREVIASGTNTLTANDALVCRDGCAGWGYFLNAHLATLDQENEWYYDANTNRLYLVSQSGPPGEGEVYGSVLPSGEIADQSGIILGGSVPEHVQHVIVDGFHVREWAGNGIMLARLLRDDQNKFITIRNNTVRYVARVGISMKSFVYQASQSGNGPDGFRGGIGGLVTNNIIDGANLFGIETASVESIFEDNHIHDIALIESLTRDAMGCDFTGTICGLNGAGIRIKLGADDQVGYSGTDNLLRYNRIERVGMNGIDNFGSLNRIERNRVEDACQTLGDCGGIRSFGGDDFNTSGAYDNIVEENIVLHTLGNTLGVPPPLEDLWGFGIYIDNFSDRTSVLNNTVVGSTTSGIVFGNSRGEITGNMLFNNSTGPSHIAHLRLNFDPTEVSVMGNEIYALEADRPILAIKNLGNVGQADNNSYFNPRDGRLVRVQDISELPMTLAEWQAVSGEDSNSDDAWFVLDPSDPPRASIFINDTKDPLQVNLGGLTYLDLDQQEVVGSFVLAPFRSRILILQESSSSIFSDNLESGNTSAWSEAVE